MDTKEIKTCFKNVFKTDIKDKCARQTDLLRERMGVLIEKAQSLWFLAKTVGWSAEQPHVILPESVS